MTKRRLIGLGVGVVAFLIVLSQTIFEVHESKQAIVLQLGQPKRIITTAGLSAKIPFVQNVLFFDKRLLCLENEETQAKQIVLSDSKRVVIETITVYKIVDPLLFYQRVRDERVLRSRLFTIVDSSQRLVLGKSTLDAILSNKRQSLMNEIQDEVNHKTKDLGIEVQDVRIKSAELPQENTDAIVQRMKTEREAVATDIRSRGAQRAEEIQASANRQANVIIADAEKLAQVVRGEGERIAGLIYGEATGLDKDFYEFYRSLQAYQQAFSGQDTPMILTPSNSFMRGFGEYLGASKDGKDVSPPPAKMGDFLPSDRMKNIESLANEGLKNIPPIDPAIDIQQKDIEQKIDAEQKSVIDQPLGVDPQLETTTDIHSEPKKDE